MTITYYRIYFFTHVNGNFTQYNFKKHNCLFLQTMSITKSVALHTLGCKLNYSETSAIERLLENDGFVKKDFTDEADVYVINTCSVTENADKECRQLVRRIQRKAPEAMVVITGCYAQLKPKEIAAIDGVDLVLGAAEKFNITAHLQKLTKGDSAKICSCDIEEVNGFNSSFSINDQNKNFFKSAGWLRLQLFILHHTNGTRKKQEQFN